MQKLLPGLRANRIPEQRPVVTALEAIASAILLVGVANGQIVKRGQRIVDNGLLAHRRADHLIALAVQIRQDLRQMFAFHDDPIVDM